MQQMTTDPSIKINTSLFKRGERLFILLPKSRHEELEKFKSGREFIHVLLKNEKQEKVFSFAARIVKAKSRKSYRMDIEIPLAYRPHATTLLGRSVTVLISPI